jgi:outer membrane protein assembly factor BamB
VRDDVRRRRTLLFLAIVSLIALGVSIGIDQGWPGSGDEDAGKPSATTTTTRRGEFFAGRKDVLADPKGFTRPYPNADVEGILTFRGNPSRSYYGKGPVPRTTPAILKRFPTDPMCRRSENLGQTKVWCGMGWTGQPLIVEREGRRWAIFGAYDGHIHFMDAITGERILPDVETDDIIKGTPTMDPDGFPLVYSGSRDNYLRVIAIDRPGAAEVLYKLHSESVKPVLWNDDWDSSPLVFGDYLIEGSESSRFWVIKLNKRIGPDGLVQVDPKVVFTTEAWDQEALTASGDDHASVESSVAVYGNTVYFGTSLGLVLGYDLTGVQDGVPPKQVFRWYSGGDIDPSIVVDSKGYLYVAQEYDRDLARSREAGQLTKLNPRNAIEPIVWKIDEAPGLQGGIYGTPGINGDVVYVSTNSGKLIAVDRTAGNILWERRLPPPTWGSPVIVDDVLLLGDCQGALHAYDVSDPLRSPPELWSVQLGGCIEATPAVWKGRIYIGTRAGHLFILGEDRTAGAAASSTSTTQGAGAATTATAPAYVGD